MEQEVVSLMKLISISNELVMDMELSIGWFDTLELVNDGFIILHNFEEDFDISFYFDCLDIADQKLIHTMLSRLLYN